MNLKNIKFKTLVFSLLLIFSINSLSFAASNLNISNWDTRAEILENGDLEIIEDITFYFNSDFNGVNRDINLKNIDGIENIRVEEIAPNPKIYRQVKNSQNGNSGEYLLEKSDVIARLKLYSPSEYEEKTFRFSYTLKNVVNRYQDISELYFDFIGEDNQLFIENLKIEIKLPKEKNDQVKLYGHGHKNSKIDFKDHTTVDISSKNIEDGELINVRVLMPVDFVSMAPIKMIQICWKL